MATDVDRVLARLDSFAARLERLERALGVEASEEPRAEEAAPAASETTWVRVDEPAIISQPIEAQEPPVEPLPPLLRREEQSPAPIVDRRYREDEPLIPVVDEPEKAEPAWEVRVNTPNEEHAAGRGAASDFEQAVGSRWLAWAGALIVIAGIGLFVKYAYDQGWIRVPPAMRCMARAAFGVTLLGMGEFLRRKVNAVAAVGVLAAG